MKNKLITFIAAAALFVALFSCTEDEEITTLQPALPAGQKMLLDETGYNPYLPDKMQLAFDSLKAKVYQAFPEARLATEGVDLDFSPNRRYVRFLPADSVAFDTLMTYDLALYNHPLDLPVLQEGEYTPGAANEAGFEWLYGVVPLDFEFPPVDHEVISDIFIPQYPDIAYDENSGGRAHSDSVEIYGMLMGTELYSLYLSGHLSEAEADEYLAVLEGREPAGGRKEHSGWDVFIEALKSVRGALGSLLVTPAYARKANPVNWCWGCIFNTGWTPNGRVRMQYNDGTGNRITPIVGLKVVINAGLKSVVTYTDAGGNFKSYRKFASRVTYTTHFRNRSERAFGNRYFRIVKGGLWFTNKHTMRSNTRQDNLTYTYDLANNGGRLDNIDELAVSAFVAAQSFFYNGSAIFQKPRNNLRIRIWNKDGRASHGTDRYILFSNQIWMYLMENNRNVTAERAITTGLHEVAHASHFALDRGGCCWSNAFFKSGPNNEDKVLKESWAIFVDHHLGRRWFPNHNSDRSQNLTFTTMNLGFPSGGREGKYTSLFFDLQDTNDQSNGGTRRDRPRDRVSGYTIPQMQDALKGATSLQHLRDNLFDRYNNGTEQFLQELIDSYADNLRPFK